jgi:hypothetical protein
MESILFVEANLYVSNLLLLIKERPAAVVLALKEATKA